METKHQAGADEAEARLAGEIADVEASIALVADGAVSSVTLTRLRFGQQLADHFRDRAADRGVLIDTTFWLDDSLCDIHLTRTDRGVGA